MPTASEPRIVEVMYAHPPDAAFVLLVVDGTAYPLDLHCAEAMREQLDGIINCVKNGCTHNADAR